MARFFANQKQDEAGIHGIALQKLIIYFMIVDAFFFVMGASHSILGFLFHAIVLIGVYRRRTCVLLIYVILNVIGFVFSFIAVIAGVVAYNTVQPVSDSSSSYTPTAAPLHPARALDFVSSFFSTVNGTTTASSDSLSSSADTLIGYVSSSSSSSDVEQPQVNTQLAMTVGIVAILFSLVYMYCKIKSVVLAHRMRKCLLAKNVPVLPTNNAPAAPTNEDVAPLLAPEPIPYDAAHPMFTHPGFVPFHPMQQQPGMPPAMHPAYMYGQQPVFYTFAPPQTPDNEKL